MKLVEAEQGIKFDNRKLKVSTLNRIFSNPESRSYLGLEIKNKNIQMTSEKKEVVTRLHKLFAKIISDDVRVAEVYDTEMSIRFMKNLFKEKPENTKKSFPGMNEADNDDSA